MRRIASHRFSRLFPLVLTAAAAAGSACGSSSNGASGATGGSGTGAHAASTAGTGGEHAASSSTGIGLGASDGGTSTITSLAFDPPSTTLTLDGTTPATASFTLKATYGSGATSVVMPESVEFDRPDLASLQTGSPVVLTASGEYAGKGTLHGIFQGLEATATLTVQVHIRDVDPGVPASVAAALDQPGLPADAAVTSLLYPYDGTVFPQGLTSPRIMWNAPSASDVYRVHYEEANYTFDGYYPITLPASLRAPQNFWDKLVASNPGGPLGLQLSRWDATAMTAYASATETWTVAPASLRGAIYYWTTSKSGGMARIQPGGTFESLNGGTCMGCHAVSSDGSTLVASVEGQPTNDGSNDNRAWVSFDLPGVTQRVASTYFSGIVAVNNDGKYTVFGDQKLHLGDTATGMLIPNTGLETAPLLPTSVGMMTPSFSPDGKHLAVVEGAGSWYHNLTGGRVAVMDFDESTLSFSNYTGLAPASSFPAGQQALAYPTFSPDAQWLAFNVADHPSGCDGSCDDSETQISRIALQSVTGTPPIDLKTLSDPATANAMDQNHTNEPTFNPIERGGYFWVVVTSMRDYGNRVTGTPNNGKKRLWVAAIDASPMAGADPSHPAFFLDGQDETTTNMRGFWSLSACVPTGAGGACMNGFECCSGFCDMGMCVTPQTLACVGSGSACTMTSDCCNNTVVSCTGGVCTPHPPT